MTQFIQGLLLGFSIAAPVGPIGLLCIRRSIVHGRVLGLVSGLGAATADAIYGVVAAFGLVVVTRVLLEYQGWLQAGGGAFLLFLGLATLREKPAGQAARTREGQGLAAAFGSTFVLTLANPMTILSFVAMFAGLGPVRSGSLAGMLLVAGVFTGSALWWLLLSSLAGALGPRLEAQGLRVINVASGAVVAGFGLWQLLRLLQSLR